MLQIYYIKLYFSCCKYRIYCVVPLCVIDFDPCLPGDKHQIVIIYTDLVPVPTTTVYGVYTADCFPSSHTQWTRV